MERYFILSNDSELVQDYNLYNTRLLEQKKFVKEFCKEKGILAHEYDMGGDGFVNAPFSSYEQKNIILSIVPTEDNNEKFNIILTKENSNGLRTFKKNSAIGKDFAKRCVENKIIVNLHQPRVSDYFKAVRLNGVKWQMFKFQDICYLKIDCESLMDDDIPEGFTVIKASKYYEVLEEYEKSSKGDN